MGQGRAWTAAQTVQRHLARSVTWPRFVIRGSRVRSLQPAPSVVSDLVSLLGQGASQKAQLGSIWEAHRFDAAVAGCSGRKSSAAPNSNFTCRRPIPSCWATGQSAARHALPRPRASQPRPEEHHGDAVLRATGRAPARDGGGRRQPYGAGGGEDSAPGLATASLIVFAHTNRHRPDQAQYGAKRPVQLTVATADTGRLTKAAMFGLDCIWRDGFLYKKAGVIFPTLIKAGAVQGSLFLHPDDPRSKSLMASIDVLNRCYGRGTVACGTATGAKGGTLRAEHLSARYTTRWGGLLAV